MKLNEEQTIAATHPQGEAALLLAGAGSGKTATLTERIAWLIEQGVPSRRILALTFTNKAAREIGERVLRRTGLAPEQAPRLTTIHSLALSFIRKNPGGFGLDAKVSPLDDYDQIELIKAILNRMGDDAPMTNPWGIQEKIEFHRARGVAFAEDYTDEVHERALRAHSGYHAMPKDELAVWKQFQEDKKAASVVDFSDMLAFVNRRFAQDAEWAGKVHQLFHHVLMDESQDTSVPAWTFVNNLVGPHNRNLYAVGDVSQSIFSFNGSCPQLILDYAEQWRGAPPKLYRLQRNHRSVPEVVRLANAIQGKMTQTLPLTMESYRGLQGEKGAIRLTRRRDPRDLAAKVAADIVNTGRDYKDFAILVRAASQIRDLEGELIRMRIPYVVRGGRSLLQTEEVRDVLSYIRLAHNPKDFSALCRAATAPRRGIGDEALKTIRMVAQKDFQGDLVKALFKMGSKFTTFGDLLQNIQKSIHDPLKALDDCIALAGYRDHIKKKYAKEPEKIKVKQENLNRLRVMIEALASDEELSAEDLIFQLTMDRSEIKDERGAVTISTIHCVDPGTIVGIPERGLCSIDQASRSLPISVATLNDPSQATERFDHPAMPCKEIRTKYGFSLVGAHHHHLLCSDLENYRPLKDWKVGDYIPIRLGIECGSPIEPTPRDIAMGELLGLLVGDGSYNDREDYCIQFTSGDQDVFGYYNGLVRGLFGRNTGIGSFTGTRQASFLCDKAVREELESLGLAYETRDEKRIPRYIFESHIKVQAAFLRGLFEADGSAGAVGVRFINTAPAVAQGAHLLLTNLGILSRFQMVREATSIRKRVYGVSVFGEDSKRYQLKIDFISARKRLRLAKLADKVRGKTNVDYLPMPIAKELPVRLSGLLKARGWSSWKLRGTKVGSTIRNAIYSKNGLSVHGASLIHTWLTSKFSHDIELRDVICMLGIYSHQRVFFDRVSAIDEVDPRPLLDIEVPETHSYWTNGLISHNSAKGLEWPTVFIFNVVEGVLPSKFARSPEEIEEERRLWYVAVTRARDVCHIMYATMNLFGKNLGEVDPSRFLVELDIVSV